MEEKEPLPEERTTSTDELIACLLATIAWQPKTKSERSLLEPLTPSAIRTFKNIAYGSTNLAGLRGFERRELAFDYLLLDRNLAVFDGGYTLTVHGEQYLESALEIIDSNPEILKDLQETINGLGAD